jgi:hypothetical protein
VKIIQVLSTPVLLCLLAFAVSAGERQSGIKMLMTAATASRHHHAAPGSVAEPVAGDSQSGIKKLIAAATASRHLPPVGNGQRVFREEASDGEGKDPVDIVVPHPDAGVDAARGRPIRSAAAGAGFVPPAGHGLSPLIAGPDRGPPQDLARQGGSAFAPTHPGILSRPHGPPPVALHALSQSAGSINGTQVGRPSFGAIGGAALIGHNVAGINGTTLRPRH